MNNHNKKEAGGNKENIENHLENNPDEFACTMNCDSNQSLLVNATKNANSFTVIRDIAATETLIFSYFTKPETAYQPIFIAAAVIGTGAFFYSAYQAYISSKEVSELEKKLKEEQLKK